MDIKEFVQQTITQIAEATKTSSDAVQGLGGVVNPHSRERDNLTRVKFDVALTVADASEGNVGGKVKVAGIFNAGGEITGKTNQEMASRVQFEILVTLPDGNPPRSGR